MQLKYKWKASATAKTQPILKQSRGHLKGLKNKSMLTVRTAAYIWGDLQVTYRQFIGEATVYINNKT